MERKQAKNLKVGDECYLVTPYLKSKRLKVVEILQLINGNKYQIKFHDGSFCNIYSTVSVLQWNETAELYLEKEPALYRLEFYKQLIDESIKEIRNELI